VILRSDRSFDDVELRLWDYSEFTMQRLIEIFTKYQHVIRKISFKYAALSERDLLTLLSMLPCLEEMTIDVSLIKKSHEIPPNISHLTRVRSFTCKVENAKLIFELPQNILTRLSFTSILRDSLPSKLLLREIFERQRNIKHLNFDPQKADALSLNLLQLKYLRIASNANALNVLNSQQRNLESLTVQETIDEDLFVEICTKLSELKALNIKAGKLELITKLSLLRRLNELTLTIEERFPHREMLCFRLNQLKKLDIVFPLNTMNMKIFIENLRENFPSLRIVKLSSVDVSEFQCLLEMSNLRSIEVTMLSTVNDAQQIIPKFPSHERLLNLTIGCSCPKTINQLLSTHFPSLDQLMLKNINNGSLDILKQALLNHRKLTQISINTQISHSILLNQFVNLVQEYGGKLTFLEFGDLNLSFNCEKLEEVFSGQFSNIYTDIDGQRLTMRSCKWKNT
jgi:hypothetical protein